MGEQMLNKGPYKYEIVQFFIRKHWTYFLKLLIFGIAIGLLIILFFLIFGSMMSFFRITAFYASFSFIVIIISIIYINTLFLQLFNYYFDMVIVTDCRIIISRKTVFLKNDNDAIDLTKIQDIGVTAHGLFRNYLNYGALIITLSMAAPPVTITHIPNPHYYLEQTNRIKREHILNRQERRKVLTEQMNAEKASREDYLQEVDQL